MTVTERLLNMVCTVNKNVLNCVLGEEGCRHEPGVASYLWNTGDYSWHDRIILAPASNSCIQWQKDPRGSKGQQDNAETQGRRGDPFLCHFCGDISMTGKGTSHL